MNLLPNIILRRFSSRPELVKIIDNIGWLFFDKILRMGVGLIVGVWVARYLGPEQFGLFNFAIAFTALFGAVAALGLQGIVVRDIVQDPNCKEETLGTAALLHIIGGAITYALIIGGIFWVRPDDPLAKSLVAIVGSVMLLQASQVAVYWFESQVQSKYTVWVQNAVFLVMAATKVVLILNNAPLIYFAWLILFEAAAVAVILFIVMGLRGQSLRNLRVSISRARSLLHDSWPLILSAIAITVYMKIDQVMLGQMLNNEAVGVYSAAVRISEVWYFIPTAIVTSVFPAILKAKKRSDEEYYAHLQKLYDLMVWLSISVALPMTFLSRPIVMFIFGVDYIEAGSVLSIHIWAAVFVFLGVASSKWFLAENRQTLNFYRTLLGAIANVIMNLILIPISGAIGAAISTVISYAVAAFLADSIHKETRPVFFMKVNSLNIFSSLKRIKYNHNSLL